MISALSGLLISISLLASHPHRLATFSVSLYLALTVPSLSLSSFNIFNIFNEPNVYHFLVKHCTHKKSSVVVHSNSLGYIYTVCMFNFWQFHAENIEKISLFTRSRYLELDIDQNNSRQITLAEIGLSDKPVQAYTSSHKNFFYRS